jgi:hypothetical protein
MCKYQIHIQFQKEKSKRKKNKTNIEPKSLHGNGLFLINKF